MCPGVRERFSNLVAVIHKTSSEREHFYENEPKRGKRNYSGVESVSPKSFSLLLHPTELIRACRAETEGGMVKIVRSLEFLSAS